MCVYIVIYLIKKNNIKLMNLMIKIYEFND